MSTNKTLLIHLASISAVLLGVGCSDANSSPDADVTTQQDLPALDAKVSLLDPAACIVTTSLVQGGTRIESDTGRRWRTYGQSLRVLSDVAIDARGQRLAPGPGVSASTYLRLSESGRILVRAVELNGAELERMDYARDSHGNAISQRGARTRARDLSLPFSEQPAFAVDYLNKYDPSGLLLSHDRTDSSGSVHYAHDANGRCEYISDSERIERREYDAAGLLSQRMIEPAPDRGLPSGSEIIVQSRDEQSRPLMMEQDGSLELALVSDGQPDVQTLWSYDDDGGVQIERIDFTSDVPNDELEQNGAPRSAAHYVELWSPGCAALQALIPSPQGYACSTD